jgi:hypothetical protein
LKGLKKSTFSGTLTGDLPVCSIVPQPTTLPRAPLKVKNAYIFICFLNKRVVLPAVLYEHQTCFLTSKKEHRLRESENIWTYKDGIDGRLEKIV